MTKSIDTKRTTSTGSQQWTGGTTPTTNTAGKTTGTTTDKKYSNPGEINKKVTTPDLNNRTPNKFTSKK